MVDRNQFLYLRHPYQGQFTPENLVFNANLQEFSKRVSYICNLETSGKLSPEEAYQKIADLWETLRRSKTQLGISAEPSQDDADD